MMNQHASTQGTALCLYVVPFVSRCMVDTILRQIFQVLIDKKEMFGRNVDSLYVKMQYKKEFYKR